ncbi:MAG: hypothetical protein WKG06_34100 [Segetibacter sp.]
MKTVLTFLVATVLSLTTFAQTGSQPKEPLNQNGDTVNFFGFVTKANYSADLKGSPTLMNLSGKDFTQSLTLIVWSTDRSKFKEAPETAFLNQYVQVKGKIEIYKGKPQIILHSEKQISILRRISSLKCPI